MSYMKQAKLQYIVRFFRLTLESTLLPLTWKKCVLHVCVQHRLLLELDPSVCHVERSQQVKAAKEGQTGQGQTGQTEAARRAERAKPRQPSIQLLVLAMEKQ